jgi:hypothetical protein
MKINEITMLGSDDVISFKHKANGLSFESPASCPNDLAVVFKINATE